MHFLIYRCFTKLTITRELVKKIEGRMNILFSGNKEKVVKETERELIKIILISILSFLFITLVGKFSIYYIIVGIGSIYVMGINSIYTKLNLLEIRLLKQFEKFLQEVRFNFKFDGMITEGLSMAVQNSEYEMSIQGQLIYENLLNQTGTDNYSKMSPNHFFLTFYALCETVMKYGDKKINNRSMFVSNIGYLKDDINTEILIREKNNALYMGLFGVTILPLFSIKLIEMWATYNMPEINSYYSGIWGSTSTIAITIITIAIYRIIMKMKYPINFDWHKSKWVDDILKVDFVNRFTMSLIKRNYKYYFNMEALLKSVVHQYNVKEFIVYRAVLGIISYFITLITLISVGIYKRGFLCLLLCIFMPPILGVFVYIINYSGLKIRKKFLEISREEEVVRFQSIIIILMHMDRMSIDEIINWMERFAIVFKNILGEISDNYSYMGNEIFIKAKEKIGFLPFERILDCFVACDRIGIDSAFSDILSDRLYYVEKHKQENEIIINNKALVSKTMAFVPLCLVIIIKLILPFVLMGIQQLRSFVLI